MDDENISPEILNAIPHRPPFLFVQRIIQITNTQIIAERKLEASEFFFKGHYPQFPLMPGVLMCEALFQTAGILMHQKCIKPEDLKGRVPVLTKVDSAKFKRMAFPGDTLMLEAIFVQQLKGFYFFKGVAKKEDRVLVTTDFILGLAPDSRL